ncbi:MAG: sulfotransferase, partial [Pseudomonadota bacterium]
MPTSIADQKKAEMDDLRRLITGAIQRGEFNQARNLCDRLEAQNPQEPDAWVFRARIEQKQNAFVAADQHLMHALKNAGSRWDVQLVAAEGKIYIGDIASALTMLRTLRPLIDQDATALARMAALFTQLERHEEASTCARRARQLEPGSLNWSLLEASTSVPVGRMEQAEQLMDQIVAASPNEADVYYNRSTLRRQTNDDNHIDELRHALSQLPDDDHRLVPIAFALGKELEDLGEFAGSYRAFERGADLRRRRMSYSVSTDEAAIARVISTFSEGWFYRTEKGSSDAAPIFIFGLPRSGTTLVDRILSTHEQVISLGEVNDVAYAVTRHSAPANDKLHLIDRSSTIGTDRLGHEISRAYSGYGEKAERFIDKTPANYLYLGLLARALPNATFIHVHRHPMASCFAMYKTLFRMGYPFSYDQSDLARYYTAYRRLMEHWQALIG